MSRHWTTVTFPRRATFDASVAQPAAFLADLLAAALNHGMPARRRGGPVIAWVGRRGLPTGALAAALRALPRREAPHLDAVLGSVGEAWPALVPRATRLPGVPPRLSALQVTRSAAETVFVFGEDRFPLLVLKRPHDEAAAAVRQELDALARAEASGIAPRDLGQVGGFHVQEGLRGLPLRVSPVWADDAATLARPVAFDGLDRALLRLAETTVRTGEQSPDLVPRLEAATGHDLPRHVVDRVADAARRLATLDVAVLQHKDLSPQNWLVDGDRFGGLVDWELASPVGVPGHDALAAAVSLFEHGIALTRWSGDEVVARFQASWRVSPFFEGARASFRSSAVAAGVPESSLDALQVAWFAARLGRLLTTDEQGHSLEASHLAAMLTTVCET